MDFPTPRIVFRCCSWLRASCLLLCSVAVSCGAQNTSTPVPPPGYQALRDLNYAGTDNWRQTLDLFVPEEAPAQARPLLVFIHGGAWAGGDKHSGNITPFLLQGNYIGASTNYRLTDEGPHPVQIHDCKAAIRWLRAHAEEYHIDPGRIAVFGISAGGHLVSLLGTSGGVPELEGTVGSHPDESSHVQCVVNFCGPADFPSLPGQGSVIDHEDANSVLGKLFSGKMSERLDIARETSPVTHITPDDPPFLHIHGTKDELVPYVQAVAFDQALDAAGIPSTLLTGQDGPHVFLSHELLQHINTFLDQHLNDGPGGVPEGPVAVKD